MVDQIFEDLQPGINRMGLAGTGFEIEVLAALRAQAFAVWGTQKFAR